MPLHARTKTKRAKSKHKMKIIGTAQIFVLKIVSGTLPYAREIFCHSVFFVLARFDITTTFGLSRYEIT